MREHFARDVLAARRGERFFDADVLVRHLTGDPPDMAARATSYLAAESELLLSDVIVAGTIYVLESFYEAPRVQVAAAMRSLLAVTLDAAMLLRAIEIYEIDRARFRRRVPRRRGETTGVGRIASFDRGIDRVGTIERIEPGR